ncbi:MAG: Ig-like domain-containing protein, partial [Synergistaceae bacterium]|nr:Ig-like domain-containing protein [Synergistaceae bacterium]
MRKFLCVLAVMLLAVFICGTAAFAATFTQKGYNVNIEYYFVQDDMFMYLHDKDNNLLAVGLDNEGCLVYGQWDIETGGVKQVLNEEGDEFVVGVHAAPPASKVFPIPEVAYKAAEERRIAFDKENQVVELEPAADAITFEEYKILEAVAKEEGEAFTPAYIQAKQAQLEADGVSISSLSTATSMSAMATGDHMDGYPLHPTLTTKVDEYANPWPGGTATTPRGGKVQKTWMAYVMFEGPSQLREGAIQAAPSYFNDVMFADQEWRPYVDERYFRGDIVSPDRFSTTYALLTGNKLTTAANMANGAYTAMDPAVFAAYNVISQDRTALRSAFNTLTAGMTNQQRNLHAMEHGIYHGSTSHGLWYGFGGRYALEAAIENTQGVNRGGIIAVTVPEEFNGPIDNAGVQGSFGESGIPTSLAPLRTAAAKEFVKKVDVRQFGTYSATSNTWTVSQAQASGGLIMTGYSWEFSAEKCVIGKLPGLWGQSAGNVTVPPADCPPEYNGAGAQVSFFVVTSHCLDEGKKGEGTEADLEYWPTRPRQFVVYQHELSHSTLSISDTYDTGAQQRDLGGASYRYPRYLNENFLPNGNIDVVNIPQDQPFPGGPTDPRNWMPGTRYTAAFGNWGPQGICGYVGASNEDLAARGGIHDGFNAVDLSRVIKPKILTENGTYTLRLGEIMKIEPGPAYTPPGGYMGSGSQHQAFYLSVHEDRAYDQAAFDWARDKLIALSQDAGFEGNKKGDNRFSIRNRIANSIPIPSYLASFDTGEARENETAFAHATGGLLITHVDTWRGQSSSTGANATAAYGLHVVNVEAHAYPSGIYSWGDGAPAYPDIHIWGNGYYDATANLILTDDSTVVMAGKSASKDSHPATQHMIERFSTDRARGEHISYDVRVNGADPADLFNQWGVDEFKEPRLFKGESRIEFGNTGTLTPEVVWARSEDIRLAHERQRRATGEIVPFKMTNIRFFAFDDPDNPEPGVACVTFDFAIYSISQYKLVLDKTDVEIIPGATSTLTAIISSGSYAVAYPGKATTIWSSNRPDIATVSASGVVTAVAPGFAVIKAAISEDLTLFAECAVKVPVIPTGVSITPNSIDLYIGSSVDITATVSPIAAENKRVTWSSSSNAIATVAASGDNGAVVTAVSIGTATITATTVEAGRTATYVVRVIPIPVASVNLDKSSFTLASGASGTLTATVAPANATYPTVSWTTSDATLATVSPATGNTTTVTANTTGKAGDVTITASADGVSRTCTVTVSPVAVSSVTLNKASATLLTGATETLTATVLPANATNPTVSWNTSNGAVATVSSSGVVTANAAGNRGTADITATAGGVNSAPCVVTVNKLTPPEGETVTLPNGAEAELPGGSITYVDGTIELVNGGVVTTPEGVEIVLPAGTIIDPDGVISMPGTAGGTATTSDGVEVELPEGTVIEPDGTVKMPPDTVATITTPDGKVKFDVSAEIKFEDDGSISILPDATGKVTITTANNTKIVLDEGIVIDGDTVVVGVGG